MLNALSATELTPKLRLVRLVNVWHEEGETHVSEQAKATKMI